MKINVNNGLIILKNEDGLLVEIDGLIQALTHNSISANNSSIILNRTKYNNKKDILSDIHKVSRIVYEHTSDLNRETFDELFNDFDIIDINLNPVHLYGIIQTSIGVFGSVGLNDPLYLIYIDGGKRRLSTRAYQNNLSIKFKDIKGYKTLIYARDKYTKFENTYDSIDEFITKEMHKE